MKEHTTDLPLSQRSYTQQSYVAFYQLKHSTFWCKRETNSTFDGSVCYIWWKYNTWISCVRESHWLTSTAAARVNQHDPHTRSTPPLSSGAQLVTEWHSEGGLSYRIWEFSGSLLWTVAPQEPDIKVALLNRFHSPAPEEWIHFLALINTLVSSNMYVTLGGWQYKFVIPLIKGSLIKFKKKLTRKMKKKKKKCKKKNREGEVPNIITMVLDS